MGTRFHLLVDLQDFSIFANEDRPPEREFSFRGDHAVCTRDFTPRVAENRIIEFQLLGESSVDLGCVAARGEVGNVELANRFAVLTERLTLGRSASGKRFREPRDDDRFLSFEVRKFVSVSITTGEFERGCRVANFQFGRFHCRLSCRHGENQGRETCLECLHVGDSPLVFVGIVRTLFTPE